MPSSELNNFQLQQNLLQPTEFYLEKGVCFSWNCVSTCSSNALSTLLACECVLRREGKNILHYCSSTRTIRTVVQFDWFPRHILSANITFPQCYGTLSRQVTVRVRSNFQSWFQNFLSTRFACFKTIFSNTDVPTRLNVHVKSVIRKTLKLTKTALSNDTFSAIV